MWRKYRRAILNELARINPEWQKRSIAEYRLTLVDFFDVLEAVGIIKSESESLHWDGQCHGITVLGKRCLIEVPKPILYCKTHLIQAEVPNNGPKA